MVWPVWIVWLVKLGLPFTGFVPALVICNQITAVRPFLQTLYWYTGCIRFLSCCNPSLSLLLDITSVYQVVTSYTQLYRLYPVVPCCNLFYLVAPGLPRYTRLYPDLASCTAITCSTWQVVPVLLFGLVLFQYPSILGMNLD